MKLTKFQKKMLEIFDAGLVHGSIDFRSNTTRPRIVVGASGGVINKFESMGLITQERTQTSISSLVRVKYVLTEKGRKALEEVEK